MSRATRVATDTGAKQPIPRVALRTYMALRIGMVAVIVALAFSVGREISRADGCVNRSISAYYYTPARSVFVGALIALGLAMIALWGKTMVEDVFLNLAGMLAPVVAFVPTLDANFCSLATGAGSGAGAQKPPDESAEDANIARKALIAANSDAVNNNFSTLLVVIALVLAFTAVIGGLHLLGRRAELDRWTVLPYVACWVAPLVLWLVGLIRYNTEKDWFDREAHWTSAVTMFVFVILAVLAAGVEKMRQGRRDWQVAYWTLAATMVVAAAFVRLTTGRIWGEWYAVHETFLIEAILIGLLAVFWILQTIDRRKDGAPSYLEVTAGQHRAARPG